MAASIESIASTLHALDPALTKPFAELSFLNRCPCPHSSFLIRLPLRVGSINIRPYV